ncbi:MAG TPA: Asp-tRNA(Asn)/Glu-tRNA(Gln) amidotransferase subunit GatC [Vicinamibacterales bacterium]|jgi:aspartyl-tRNA(Asn)/glutamyl-tRNA(Gln) amidotransferase subunit C
MATVLSPADVERIAALARLELTDDERSRFAAQLTAILAYADQVQQADTAAAVQPAAPAPARLRDDEPRPSLDRDAALAEAPAADRSAGLFTVPRVLGS